MSIQKQNTNDQSLTKSEPDPFRWMREMMPAFFGPSFEGTFAPAFEVKETKDSFQFKADVPGMKESDIEVKLTGNRLAISGSRQAEREDKSETYYTYERSYGNFQRTFVLPDGLDTEHIHAELKDGVLTVALSKKAGAHTKTIAIKTGEKSKS